VTRIAIVLLFVASTALADDDKAQAVALFEEGLKELKAGNFEKACASLRKSNELHADSGTRGSLARCYEKLGKVASAWKLWVDLSTTAPKNLRGDAAANAAKLEPRLPKYMFKVAAGTPKLGITIDGVTVDPTPDVAVPIDAGKYIVEVNAAGYAAWKTAFAAVEGKTAEIKIELTPIKSNEPEPQPQPPPITEKPTPKSSRKTIGFAMLGVGGALAITGTVFGVIARSRYNDAQDICGGDIDVCNVDRLEEAQDKVDTARSAGNIATITLIAGGAALVTGVVLIVTAPKASRSVAISPMVGSDTAGVLVRGGF
jgi:hypothetical protein